MSRPAAWGWHSFPWALKRETAFPSSAITASEWVIIDMGVQCAGGTAVGVYATNAWPQVEYVIGNSDSKFFFVENEEQLDKWFQFRDKVPRLKKGHRVGFGRVAAF